MKYYQQILLFFVVSVFFCSCSDTYNNYSVDIETAYEVSVDGENWNLRSFQISEKQNTTTGDTATLKRLLIDATNSDVPYPKSLRLELFFSTQLTEAEINADLSTDGIFYSGLLTEFDYAYANLLYIFQMEKQMPAMPVCSIHKYDMLRGLISGQITGALYEKNNHDVLRIVRVNFSNYRIINHKN